MAPPPNTWDRNYNDHLLEVKDDTGRIVLQVRLFSDRVQIQGEWWDEGGRGVGLKKCPQLTPACGSAIEFFGPNHSRDRAIPIVPLFVYPSDKHLGELVK